MCRKTLANIKSSREKDWNREVDYYLDKSNRSLFRYFRKPRTREQIETDLKNNGNACFDGTYSWIFGMRYGRQEEIANKLLNMARFAEVVTVGGDDLISIT